MIWTDGRTVMLAVMTRTVGVYHACTFSQSLSSIWKVCAFLLFFSLLNLTCFMMMTSDKTAGHVMLTDQSRVAYGGILKELSPTVKADDSDVVSVIRFAIQYADKNHAVTIPKDASGKPEDPVLSNLEKLKLQATRDGETQHHVVETKFVDARQQFQRRKVIYGMTYSFCLSWSVKERVYRHSFVVSLDRQRNMYMFGHTFKLESSSPKPQGGQGCIQDADSLRQYSVESDEFAVRSQSECRTGDAASATDQSQCTPSSKNVWNFQRKPAQSVCESTDREAERSRFGAGALSIATQNIWNFNGIAHGDGRPVDQAEAYGERVAHLGDLVGRLKAEVVGFQEVRFDLNSGSQLGPCQVQHLAHYLPKYQFIYQPAVNYVPDNFNRSEEGLAIFSLYPIVSHDFILLSRDMNDEDDKHHQRICLHAEIATPTLGLVHVFVTHLSLSAAARERSVLEIWDFMSKHRGPAVLIGDMNDHPQSQVIRFLNGELAINGIKTERLHDAWLMKNKEPRAGPRAYAKDEQRDDGLTFSTLNEHLGERIDYIFVRLPEDMQMTSVSLVDDGRRGPMAASDHLGLQASIAGL